MVQYVYIYTYISSRISSKFDSQKWFQRFQDITDIFKYKNDWYTNKVHELNGKQLLVYCNTPFVSFFADHYMILKIGEGW